MQCPRCQQENRKGRRFCAECGSPLAVACISCAFVNEPGEKFCGGCGVPLTSPPAASSPAPSQQQTTTAQEREPVSYTPPLAEPGQTPGGLRAARASARVVYRGFDTADLKDARTLLEVLSRELTLDGKTGLEPPVT